MWPSAITGKKAKISQADEMSSDFFQKFWLD